MCRAGGPRCDGSGRSRTRAVVPSNVAIAAAPGAPPMPTVPPGQRPPGLTEAVAKSPPRLSPREERRRVDKDGFVVGDRPMYGQRPGVGSFGARVKDGEGKVHLIVGLDHDDSNGGLLLHTVPFDEGKTSQAARNRALNSYRNGEVEADQISAEGLIALDAWLPDDE